MPGAPLSLCFSTAGMERVVTPRVTFGSDRLGWEVSGDLSTETGFVRDGG